MKRSDIQTAWSEFSEDDGHHFSGEIFFDELLSKHVYYKIGGPAEILLFPKSLEDLKVIREFLHRMKTSLFFFGLGSNLLVSDDGIPGITLKLSKLNSSLMKLDPTALSAGASVSVHSFLRLAAKEGLGGLEFLSGVPGNIGGAISMNAGTHLGECAQALKSFRVFSFSDTSIEEFPKADLRTVPVTSDLFSYRKNHAWNPMEIIFDSEWNYLLGTPEKVKNTLDETLRLRKATQPLDYPSCGSVFKNPEGTLMKAWEVVEKSGLRGLKIGAAQISEKHPNWIVNLGGAKATDVIDLIERCQSEALEKFGVKLEPEVKRIGSFRT